ncbi:MAG: GNAT family N-acetyltransferase [Verrucomicrobia subdivision 3 bacterium]|nr:GNAT family N-acetyltransferase [Limisphaerales bacterium]
MAIPPTRIALPQDAPEWLRMRRALWPDCTEERHALEIQQLTAPEHPGVVFVASRSPDALCGFAELSIRCDHVDGSSSVPIAYVEGWYVDPDMRGGGVGRRLIEAAEQWALACGFKELASDAELDNDPGIQAHLSCGFVEACRAVHFIKRLA